MDESFKIINGIKTNDKETWNALYKEFMPVAVSLINNSSGNIDDAKDLLQETLLKVFLKCTKGYQHENIKAIIAKRLKWDWLDMIRSKKNSTNLKAYENVEGEAHYLSETIIPLHPKGKLANIFSLSKKYLKRMKSEYRTEDFLNYDNLSETQKRMIEILLDKKKTSEKCKKLLLLTEFLPISDSTLIATEMGYVKTKTEEGIKKGKDTLKTRKRLCLSKFKQNFHNFKTDAQ